MIATDGYYWAGYFFDHGRQNKYLTFYEFAGDDYTGEFEDLFPNLQIQGDKNALGYLETQIKVISIQQRQCQILLNQYTDQLDVSKSKQEETILEYEKITNQLQVIVNNYD